MARRRSSTAEDFIDIVAMMPWYAGVIVAVVTYAIFSGIAASPNTSNPGVTIWHMLAQIGRIVVPVLCLFGTAASAWKQHERRKLVDGVLGSSDANALNAMSWRQFERLVGEGFRLQGYSVVENEAAGPDGGVDLVLRKDGEKVFVQCKQWRSVKVGVSVVRELLGSMTALGANRGIVVTSGRFTPEAQAFARGRSLQLMDGPALHALLGQARGAGQAASAPPSPARFEEPAFRGMAVALPTCPVCSGAMVRRMAKRGANAGNEFWGCQDFPRCRGTLRS